MESREQTVVKLQGMAKRMRCSLLDMALGAGKMGAHIGPGLSIIDITAVLYGAVMRLKPDNPFWPKRDRFILSKGHGSLGYYTALAEAGFITADELKTFESPESFLTGQPAMCPEKGIECSSGSLGLGLSMGVGIALAEQKGNTHYNTYVLMGDGECNEGTVWEAAISASHLKLSSLIAIVDANGIQSDGICKDIMDMGNQQAKWRAFGWEAVVVDGHDVGALLDVFTAPRQEHGKPLVVIATTVKGKGVSFMEHDNNWHHNRLSRRQYEDALAELTA